MSEKKNIDRLFQEKFKDFEAAPPEFVWDNLEEILQKKKKRRVVPLWVRMGGIAAALVVGMLFLYPFFIGNTPTGTVKSGSTSNGVVYDDSSQQEGAAAPNQTQETAQPGTVLQPNRNVQGTGPGINPDAVVSTETVITSNQKPQYTSRSNGRQKTLPGGVSGSGKSRNNTQYSNASPEQQTAQNSPGEAKGGAFKNPGSDNTNRPNPNTQDIAQAEKPNAKGSDNKGSKQQENAQGFTTTPFSQNKEVAETVVDSVAKEENGLEKLQREQQQQKEEKALAQNNQSDAEKWNVRPQLGPLLYSSMGNGSPIDGQFAANSKSYDNQMSYGVGLNYAINKRLAVRSGVNTVNLSYATQNIEFYASLNQSTNNVARTMQANIVVQNAAPKGSMPVANLMMADVLPQEKFNGSMVQSTGYIEVPLEMEYALLDKKFGINVIGGFSTFFLNENNVSVISTQGLSTNVGEAQNLNDVSFSTNLGVGFKYRFLKQFEANFEPTFKYQVNTYNRDAGNFKPYFIGLYTGVSFSF